MNTSFGSIFVPDEGPENAKVVFIGEAPGGEEEKEGRPFIGFSGNKLDTVLTRNGLPRETVRLANLFHYRPRNNKLETVVTTREFSESVLGLYDYLRAHRPNVVCTMGNWPTYFLTGKCKLNKGRKTHPISGILNWRGSILSSNVSGLEGLKVIPTVHPAAVLRDSKLFPTFDLDIKRVKLDSEYPELRLPERKFVIAPKGAVMEEWTNRLLAADRLTVDIENVKGTTHLLCVGFALSPLLSVCFEYDEHDPLLRDCLARILSSTIPKCFHFGSHDTEVLHLNGYEVNNYAFDTFVSQHVMWPELPRSLQYLTSIITREPYYKDEVKEEDSDTKVWSSVWATKKEKRAKLYSYNCKDTCTDFEIWLTHERELQDGPEAWRRFFKYEMEMLAPAHAIMRAGMLVDQIRMQQIRVEVEKHLGEQQKALNGLLGVKDTCNRHPCICGRCINVNSTKQIPLVLYEALALPKRTKRGSDGESKLTTEENALVSLIALCKDKVDTLVRGESINAWRQKLLIVKLIVMIRGGRKMKSSYLDMRLSEDGRCRSRYKWGTETGRWAAEKYCDGTGVNGQTFPRGGVEVEVAA